MSTATVRLVVQRFLKDPTPTVLVIRGRWGVGKTYFWRSCVTDYQVQSSRKRYSYVSLFGLASIRDLQVAVVVNSTDIANVRRPDATGVAASSSIDVRTAVTNLVAKAVPNLPSWWGKTLSVAVETIAPHLVQDNLICLDDFERLPASGLKLEEVLGYVSTLKEEKNCKIVLIFNDEELRGNLETYRRYREKVVDMEVLFEPTVEEAAELAVTPDVPYRDLVRQKLAVLEVRNIRLIRKVISNVKLVQPLLRGARQSVVESVVAMVVLVTWIEYDSGADRPTLDFLKQWNRLSALIDLREKQKATAEGETEEDPKFARWAAVLEQFNVSTFDNCDAAIARAITTGYTEDSGLEGEIEAKNRATDAGENDERFTAAWRLYHDSFGDDEAELATTIDQTFDAAASTMSVGNFEATVRLLRTLGREKLADDLIDRYVKIRGGEPSIFDLDQWGALGEIRDAKVKQRFAAEHAKRTPRPTLEAALRVAARRQGYAPEVIEVLRAATADDLYAVFTSKLGRELGGIVGGCLRFAHTENDVIALSATRALKRIAGESRINRARIEGKYGIKVDEPEAQRPDRSSG